MQRREKHRDDRDYDTTQLHEAGHGKTLHRDYSAHFFRWSFARRFITSKDHVLEIGCGEDRPLSKILVGTTRHVATYVGVDLNKLRPSAHQWLAFFGEFNFVEQHKELLKVRPGGFDVVVHLEVIEHMRVEYGARLLKACHACLRPGGTMLMSTPCYDGVRHAANHIHEYTVAELAKATKKAGFEVADRFGTFMDLKHIGKAMVGHVPRIVNGPDAAQFTKQVANVKAALADYFDGDALSNIFGPLYPDHARNNLWVCQKR